MLTEIFINVAIPVVTCLITGGFIMGAVFNRLKVQEHRILKVEDKVETLEEKDNLIQITLAEIKAQLKNITLYQEKMFNAFIDKK